MPERKHSLRQPYELHGRGVRLFKENRPDYSCDSAACASVAEKLGCSRFTLRQWCIQEGREAGERTGHGPENLAAVRRTALKVIRLLDDKLSVRQRFRWAAQMPEHRLKLIRNAVKLAPEVLNAIALFVRRELALPGKTVP